MKSGDRREAIADAAIAIVAREGLRSLTHRAIDKELGLPTGSTSYYARTRRDLIEAMVHRLAARTAGDMAGVAERDITGVPGRRPVDDAAERLARLLDRLAERPGDHLARYALVVELTGDPELHARLTSASPARAGFLAAAAETLRGLGVEEPERHAPALVAVVDGLLLDRVAGSGMDPATRPDARETIAAYLRGLTR
ncbi:TetR/AcrR family transcriptional regulator [Actinoplanes sp. NPDC000266]